MLAVNVATLLKSAPGTTRDLEIDDPRPVLGEDLTLVGPVTGTARLTRTQQGVLARCTLQATVEMECSRCLGPAPIQIEISPTELFRPSVNVLTGTPLAPGDDEALQIDERHMLDLSEMARQYFLLMLPLQPVCRPECPGLCPACGADLNLSDCSCPTETPSGPFAALARLLDAAQ